MSPAASVEDELPGTLLYGEVAGVEMRLAECTTYLEFLAYGVAALGTYNLQFPDASALAALQRNEVHNVAKLHLEFRLDDVAQLFRSIAYLPGVEVLRLLVVVVEYLRDNLFVTGVTEGVVDTYKIWLWSVFPAVLELLGLSATTLRETGITYLVAIHQYLSACSLDSIYNVAVCLFRDTLIALTVVVGTDIEDGMVVAVVPAPTATNVR